MRNIIRNIIIVVNVAVALLLLLSYFLPGINPGVLWWPSLMGLLYPYLLIVNALFVLFWMLVSWKYLFISLICILAGYNLHRNYIQLEGLEINRSNSIKVLSFNANHFYTYLKDKNIEDNILSFIAGQEADIICLQETKLQKIGELNPVKLKERFPNIKYCQLAHQSKWNGPVTFSRFPIINMGELRFEETNNMVIFTDIIIDADTVRIYNCHLQSYGIRPEDYSIIDTLSLQNVKVNEMKQLGLKLRDGYKQRAVQVEVLKKHIEQCPYPVIVCGDFNDTPNSFTYRKVGETLSDSFVESGKGISNTYRGKLPSYRIDYIMYSKHFTSFNYRRHRVNYSDHYPISVNLEKVEF